MRTTAPNIDDADKVMWLHVVTNWLIVGYATWLLRRHTRTFALLRQLYLTTAGDTNLWRAVHMPTTILQQMLVQGREVEAEMDVRAMRAGRWRAATCARAVAAAGAREVAIGRATRFRRRRASRWASTTSPHGPA